MTAPILVFGWGNPSRGDDALGPLFIDRLLDLQLPGVECLTDFQLQVEHALDLQDRQLVLFVDASVDTEAPFTISAIGPNQDASFTSHAMSPQSVLQVYCDLHDSEPPPTWLLAIRAERFELGDELSASATSNLDAALAWAQTWLIQAPTALAATPMRA
jgi:hydrogenase maturation protease